MKRSELKNYIRETILNKLDEAETTSVTVTPGSSKDDVKAAIDAVEDSGKDAELQTVGN